MSKTLPLIARFRTPVADRRTDMLHNAPATATLWCLRAARSAGFIAVLVGVVVVLGWLLDVDALTRSLPGSAAMKPNTALGFIVLGLALAFSVVTSSNARRKRHVSVHIPLAALVALLGAATSVEYALNLDLGLDDLLFWARHSAADLPDPGRMAPFTAASFVLLGASLAAMDMRSNLWRRASE